MMRITFPRVLLTLLAMALLAPVPATATTADGGLGPATGTPVGSFGGVEHIQYDGIFEGETSTGPFRVPYRITAPADAGLRKRTVVVEPSHFAIGLGALEIHLGRSFLLGNGFVHAGIGYSTTSFGPGADLRILDPAAPGTFIGGGFDDEGGRTDDEIIVELARALAVDRDALAMLGRVRRTYLTGFSDSSVPVLRLVSSGRAAGVFDLALPFTAEGADPQEALAAGRYPGKLIVVNSEAEDSASLVDDGGFPHQYRFYAVAGTPHIPDPLTPFFSNETTPASYRPALRAHFLQGDRWAGGGKPPPPSTHLRSSDGETIDRDANGNAITVDAGGRPVPRLPLVEIGEATFITGFLGAYDAVKTIAGLGFASHRGYLKAFAARVADYVRAGYMLREDAEEMMRRAALCPSLTFTETYRDRYASFSAIEPCVG